MTKINNKIIVPVVVMVLICACSSDENVYYSDGVIESKFNTSAVENSRLNSDIDYEVIPVGENNYVYLPKMTTTKAVTRSTEIERTYSATINSGLSTHYGPLSVTFTWDSRSASFHLSEGYTTVCPQFVYTINGSTLSVSLTMTVWCDNVRLGDLDYSGTLMG